jgi:hypothetical protein
MADEKAGIKYIILSVHTSRNKLKLLGAGFWLLGTNNQYQITSNKFPATCSKLQKKAPGFPDALSPLTFL